MKKIAKWLVSGAALVMSLGLTASAACATNGVNGADGANGSDGKSAYQIAVDNGFTGTEAEWLESLKGSDGTDGVDGSKWFTGRGLPADNTVNGAKEGDFYVNVNTNTVYKLEKSGENLVWTLLVNVNEQHNVSVWDGKIPGWQAPNLSEAEIIANRPVSYVVDENAKTVDLYNAEAFAWFAYRSVIGVVGYEGYTVTLHCDVDLNNNMWVPIGLGARSNAPGVAFKGVFDGNGHTIYNLDSSKYYSAIKYDYYTDYKTNETTAEKGYYIDYANATVEVDIPLLVPDDGEIPYGLFATTCDATIKNLNVEGVRIDMPAKAIEGALVAGKNYSLLFDSVSALVGYAHGNLTLENCSVGSPDGGDYIKNVSCGAGLVGRAYAGSGDAAKEAPYGSIIVRNCNNYVDITGLAKTGGLLANGNDKAGGIMSFPRYYSKFEVTGCNNYGAVRGHIAGGIVGTRQGDGFVDSPSKILDCNNYGTISADWYAGGIIGYRTVADKGSNASYVISGCVNYGEFDTSYGDSTCGTIAGYFKVTSAQAAIINCLNFGSANGLKRFGGVIGSLVFNASATGSLAVAHCINNGNIVTADGLSTTTKDGCFSSLNLGGNTEADVLVIDSFINLGKVLTKTAE